MLAKTFAVIMLGAGMALIINPLQNIKTKRSVFSSPLPIATTPSPTITPADKIRTSVMDSPEGTKSLTLKKQESKGQTSYTLFVSPKSGEQKQQIFLREKSDSGDLSIPYNTWSPDNIYVFLKETTPLANNYFVIQSSGDSFPNNLPYLSVQELFKEKVPKYVIEDITGWGGVNLLLINTKSIENDNKVSFWLDVPSQTFIQLGTYFK